MPPTVADAEADRIGCVGGRHGVVCSDDGSHSSLAGGGDGEAASAGFERLA